MSELLDAIALEALRHDFGDDINLKENEALRQIWGAYVKLAEKSFGDVMPFSQDGLRAIVVHLATERWRKNFGEAAPEKNPDTWKSYIELTMTNLTNYDPGRDGVPLLDVLD